MNLLWGKKTGVGVGSAGGAIMSGCMWVNERVNIQDKPYIYIYIYSHIDTVHECFIHCIRGDTPPVCISTVK